MKLLDVIMRNRFMRFLFIALHSLLLTGCGFHLQGEVPLAPPLHRMYLQVPDPYGPLERALQQYLKISKVVMVPKTDATTILAVLRDDTSQTLLSISGTQQTRQYLLQVTVVFEVNNRHGATIIGPYTLVESRTITVQANQILGSSNEASLFYQQMRRTLAYRIITMIASQQSAQALNNYAFENMPPP